MIGMFRHYLQRKNADDSLKTILIYLLSKIIPELVYTFLTLTGNQFGTIVLICAEMSLTPDCVSLMT